MESDSVAPEGSARFQQARAERPGELDQRAPAGGGDLLVVLGNELVAGRAREEDVRPPGDIVGLIEKARLAATR